MTHLWEVEQLQNQHTFISELNTEYTELANKRLISYLTQNVLF